jgi:hypothetical protein
MFQQELLILLLKCSKFFVLLIFSKQKKPFIISFELNSFIFYRIMQFYVNPESHPVDGKNIIIHTQRCFDKNLFFYFCTTLHTPHTFALFFNLAEYIFPLDEKVIIYGLKSVDLI